MHEFYGRELLGRWPSTLTESQMKTVFNQSVLNNLPTSLQVLKLKVEFERLNDEKVSEALTSLQKDISFACCPETKLTLAWLLPIVHDSQLVSHIWPQSLTNLTIKYNHFARPGLLPISLRYLTVSSFNHPLTIGFLRPHFNQLLLPGQLPMSIQKLFLGRHFNTQILKNVLPKHLITLQLGSSFRQQIEAGILPSSLRYLRCYWNTSRTVHKKSLRELLPKNVLPEHLVCVTTHAGADIDDVGSYAIMRNNALLGVYIT